MFAAELRRLDRFLQRHTELDHIEEALQRPLILLVQSHSAKGHERLASA